MQSSPLSQQDEAVLSECIASLEAEYNATGKANKKQEIRPVNVGAELSTLCSGAALAVVGNRIVVSYASVVKTVQGRFETAWN